MKRKDYLSWEQYFMGIAELSALRSKDPNTRVGACLVNEEKRIIGIGYNGFPSPLSDDEFPWTNEGKFSETKYPYVVHAEMNALLNSIKPVKGASLYVTLFPCHECVKMLIQSGIKKIIYKEEKYRDSESDKAAKKMLKAARVDYQKFTP
ncbi:MAG: dCMP deaminase family protein [Acholeplasmatales bacterium]|jgi:dCMP deaminase|nr:dCMP deaminase family protein [Acholeplasmataceae bacterium]MDY0115305.1 dCMP deaminase family protein [Acholeplasmatales bacterium]MCK9233920.1 dCMP deaminase family protein [Acholeplasmataceae bacterium]MCK9289240.1 dCMP deaminase family protein [Acholeplasmataceae bacterium]MCK9427654.1 dCMP deaminase family protein [Acholeplasmataceae bacterium]